MGGWGEGSRKYSLAVRTQEGRVKLAKSIFDFVKNYNFDGFDLDWEYPCQRGGVPEDRENYVEFLKELKRTFGNSFILSVAASAGVEMAKKSYIISEITKYVDFINLMTYDFHDYYDKITGCNAPLYPSPEEIETDKLLNIDAVVHYWVKNGAPAEKVILGVPFYGHTYNLSNPQNNNLGAPCTGPGDAGPYTQTEGTLGYNEICEQFKQKGWTQKTDRYQRVPYAHKGSLWVSYDDVESLTEKSKYIKKLNLGGAMIWSIETDDTKGVCGEKFPLLRALNKALRNVNFIQSIDD